jgi:hypothetical protein
VRAPTSNPYGQPGDLSIRGFARNAPLMARIADGEGCKLTGHPQSLALTWTLSGAGDENRTRTISLGSSAVTAPRGADLAFLAVPSDRGCPLVTLVNGTLRACLRLTRSFRGFWFMNVL